MMASTPGQASVDDGLTGLGFTGSRSSITDSGTLKISWKIENSELPDFSA
jgi:hypothetical protein